MHSEHSVSVPMSVSLLFVPQHNLYSPQDKQKLLRMTLLSSYENCSEFSYLSLNKGNLEEKIIPFSNLFSNGIVI